MAKKQKKIKVVKNSKKGFPKDLTKTAAEPKAQKGHDPRIPAVGTIITRQYKGEEIKVKVLETGFEFKDKIFKSISAAAVHIAGGPVSGYAFFKLGAKND